MHNNHLPENLLTLLKEVPPVPSSIEQVVMHHRARQRHLHFVKPAIAALFVLGIVSLYLVPPTSPTTTSMESYFSYLTEETEEYSYEPLSEINVY